MVGGQIKSSEKIISRETGLAKNDIGAFNGAKAIPEILAKT